MRRSLPTSISLAILALLAPMVLLAGSASAAPAPAPAGPDRVLATGDPADGSLGPAAARAVGQRYLVPDQARYEAAKRAAASVPPSHEPATLVPAAPQSPSAPVVSRNWQGVRDPAQDLPDPTGAIGTTRYIELVTEKFAIYDRTSNTPLSTGNLQDLICCSSQAVRDPQVIWDSQTSRFYYAARKFQVFTMQELAFGFSKTDSPTSADDFCRYTIPFGATVPQDPKLGDTADFLLIGTNNFSGSSSLGAFVQWIAKPAAGPSCPAAGTLATNSVGPLRDANGQLTESPVPVNQTDASPAGYIVSRPNSVGASDNFLTLFRVTNVGGVASIPITGTSVRVPAYSIPPNARQPGVTQVLDTLDARVTQAVSAIDPSRGGAVGLWTQHTVLGGAGAQVRWYEIDPVAAATFQLGVLSHPTLFVFNAAISPDRAVNGASARFGSNMVIQFNTSSTTTTPAIRLVSKVGAAAISPAVTIVTSAESACSFWAQGAVCPWGEYAAATPDPIADVGATVGRVWITNQFIAVNAGSTYTWATRNAAVSP